MFKNKKIKLLIGTLVPATTIVGLITPLIVCQQKQNYDRNNITIINKVDSTKRSNLSSYLNVKEFKWGDITVLCNLVNNDKGQEAVLINPNEYDGKYGYVSGEGTLVIPDHVVSGDIIYYVKRIPSFWSDGENKIKGIKFDNVTHLEEISSYAFAETNALDCYLDRKTLCVFPEGLKKIGNGAFEGTSYSSSDKILGYSFPSTLVEIGSDAFKRSPYIDGDDDNGEIYFRSIVNLGNDSFDNTLRHDTKYVIGTNTNIAMNMAHKLNASGDFSSSSDMVIPITREQRQIYKWGDITVKCKLTDDKECTLVTDHIDREFGYISGQGTLIIPDYVEYNGSKYYVKRIPSHWSDGSNNITGVVFNKAYHLEEICDYAFYNTNALDCYQNKNELCVFPEGLKRIGISAFEGTNFTRYKILGYSFPSTLNIIDNCAFKNSPLIFGDLHNGELHFKSLVNFGQDVFTNQSEHYAKFIYGLTDKIASEMSIRLSNTGSFCKKDAGENLLIPKTKNGYIFEGYWGDISVRCKLIDNEQKDESECILLSGERDGESGYISGKGTLIIPDYVQIKDEEKKYYVKKIPSNWSNNCQNILGLEFNKDVSHLKTICNNAFYNTRVFNNYCHNLKKENARLVSFPEGLETIGESAFALSVDSIRKDTILGYSFPSTLKSIDSRAFSLTPRIESCGSKDSCLEFKSDVKFSDHGDEFSFFREDIELGELIHNCKYLIGPNKEITEKLKEAIKLQRYFCLLLKYFTFNQSEGYLQMVYPK